ncbi:nickel ABC transporter substrate-binding protein [Heyndrickxia sp. NPDC080065]|uniref:nickel ABC transporter substrate-binding protein n=1 Tax=Heyndrickxia sp. NPDC080065 TaxID=3390568 RepID=UPI003D022D6C
MKKSFISILIGLILVLSGCNPFNNSKNEADKSSNNQKVLTVAIPTDPGPLNPHQYAPNELTIQSTYYEPLIDYTEDGKLKGKLAESWKVSKDGKTIDFTLRKNVKFSDGSAFTADSVKMNFDAIMKHKDIHSWVGLIDAIDTYKVLDDHHFQVKLKKAYYPALQEFTIVRPLRFLGEKGFPKDGDTFEKIEKPITTGPWVVEDYKKDSSLTLVQNKYYWGEKPKVDKIIFKVIPDAESRVLALENGEIDMMYGENIINMDRFKQIKDAGKLKTDISNPVATRTLIVNTKDKLKDKNLRLALQHAINKEDIVKQTTNGIEKKADQLVAPNFPYSDVKLKPYDYDVTTAESYLDKAGWKKVEGKTYRQKNGKPLIIEGTYLKTNEIDKQMALAIQSDLKKIGIDFKLKETDIEVRNKNMEDATFDVLFWSTYGAPYDPHSLVSTIAQEGFGIKESEVNMADKDRLHKEMKDVLYQIDERKRQETYKDIFTHLHDEAVFLPLSYITNIAIYSDDVSGIQFSAHRDETPYRFVEKK